MLHLRCKRPSLHFLHFIREFYRPRHLIFLKLSFNNLLNPLHHLSMPLNLFLRSIIRSFRTITLCLLLFFTFLRSHLSDWVQFLLPSRLCCWFLLFGRKWGGVDHIFQYALELKLSEIGGERFASFVEWALLRSSRMPEFSLVYLFLMLPACLDSIDSACDSLFRLFEEDLMIQIRNRLSMINLCIELRSLML